MYAAGYRSADTGHGKRFLFPVVKILSQHFLAEVLLEVTAHYHFVHRTVGDTGLHRHVHELEEVGSYVCHTYLDGCSSCPFRTWEYAG